MATKCFYNNSKVCLFYKAFERRTLEKNFKLIFTQFVPSSIKMFFLQVQNYNHLSLFVRSKPMRLKHIRSCHLLKMKKFLIHIVFKLNHKIN